MKRRAIVHVDLDAFYVQVERRLDPTLNNVPCAVVQYNAWQGGAIIALSYEAKALGVKRSMRGDEAKKLCPNIRLVTVRVKHDKADLENYRDAGSIVFETCGELGAICERTSIDEAYLDVTDLANQLLQQEKEQYQQKEKQQNDPTSTNTLTPLLSHNTHVINLENINERNLWLQNTTTSFLSTTSTNSTLTTDNNDTDTNNDDLLLIAASSVVQRLRDNVYNKTGYTLSAGIASNKMLAKMISGKHKPNKQTLIRQRDVVSTLSTLPLRELNGFGGKLGDGLMNTFKIQTVGSLNTFSLDRLTSMVQMIQGLSSEANNRVARWIYATCRGDMLADDPKTKVTPKLRATTIGCSKTFTGVDLLQNDASVLYKWLLNQSTEIFERLIKHYIKYREVPTKLILCWSTGMKQVLRKGNAVTVTGGGGSTSTKYPINATKFETKDDMDGGGGGGGGGGGSSSSSSSSSNSSSTSSGSSSTSSGSSISQISIIATLAHGIIERVRKAMVVKEGKWQFTMLGISTTDFIERAKENSSIQHFLSTTASGAAVVSSASFRPTTLESIDPSDLSALPLDIREEIQKDLEEKKKKRKRMNGNGSGKSGGKTNTLMQSFARKKKIKESNKKDHFVTVMDVDVDGHSSGSNSNLSLITSSSTSTSSGSISTSTSASLVSVAEELPEGWDVEVFRGLPVEMQQQQMEQHRRQTASPIPPKRNMKTKKKKKSKKDIGSFFKST